jgi:protein-tyrosine-phosphatase
MAEGLLQARLGESWDVRSAGTHAYGGDAPSGPGCEATQREYGIEIGAQRSTALTVPELEAADHIFTMSVQQAKLAAALGGVGDRVRLFGSFAPASAPSQHSADPGGGDASAFEVPDPMGGAYEDYRICLERLHRCADKCAPWLENGAEEANGPPSTTNSRWRFQAG